MFGLWKRRKPDVIKYEHGTFENFECSPSEFYDSIEMELAAHEMPALIIERIDYKEGGLLSAKRQYLRIRRERLVFDVCLAAFGTYWFFSRRYSLIPFSLRVWEVLVVLLVIAGVEAFYVSLFGFGLGTSLFVSSLLALVLLMRNVRTLGLEDLDAALMQIPVLGAIYEVFLRKETYYREDTRNAYITIVDAILKQKFDEMVEAKGAKLIDYKDATPPSHPGVLSMIADLLRVAGR